MKRTIIIILVLFTSQLLSAQTKSVQMPTVGKTMPDFQLEVQNYSKKNVTLSDFKGQWLILDFWNRYCGVCIKSFPKMDSLQRTFDGRLKIILSGYTGSKMSHQGSDDKMIREIYERNRVSNHLDLTIAFDSILFDRYDIYATPYLIVVDPKGVVRAITTRVYKKDIEDLMAGRTVNLKPAYTHQERLIRNKEKYKKQTN